MRCTGFLRRCCSESPCFWAQNLNRSAMRINGPIISFTHFPSFHMYIRPNGNFPQVTVSLEGESRRDRPDLGRGRRGELRAHRGAPQESPVPPLGHQVRARVRANQDRGPSPRRRPPRLHQRPDFTTLLRPSASLRTHSRGVAPPTLPGVHLPKPELGRWDLF